ncbi:hypothetical protein Acr_14g0004320 [Actinidia rufa]|uniref:Uncharacterized protein n=1 Tax=Actinidia rufa TaxID=165716 RepID=A0A7J0FQY5_9ERIC|nr:hypothetical protein Acr_14g0004320 [Actinidia rufa]
MLFPMMSKSNNDARGNRDAIGHPSHAKNSCRKDQRLLIDPQKAVVAPHGKGQGSQTLDDGEDCQDKTMRCMLLEMEETRQILVTNNFKLPANSIGESLSEV